MQTLARFSIVVFRFLVQIKSDIASTDPNDDANNGDNTGKDEKKNVNQQKINVKKRQDEGKTVKYNE